MKKSKRHSPEDRAIMEKMGARMRRIREGKMVSDRKKWTQESIGSRVGVSGQTIGYIERGKKWPGPSLLLKISLDLSASIDDLMGRRHLPATQKDGHTVNVSG